MVNAAIEELKEQALREGLGRRRAEGRAEGRATLVSRLVGLKFGAETEQELPTLLEGITDLRRIARIGGRIAECETRAELLAPGRTEELPLRPPLP